MASALLIVPCAGAGPAVPENSMVWPQPQSQDLGSRIGFVATPPAFNFVHAASSSSKLLANAFLRCASVAFQHKPEPMTWIGRCDAEPCPPVPTTPDPAKILRVLKVSVQSADESLDLGTSENYTLSIQFPNATLISETVFGAMRGLETFGQLVQPDYSIREQSITDWPRFPFRAVLVDSARHFLPVPLLLAHLDAMAYSKLNVLHWHIVDSPSFPYASTRFPHLARGGAFDKRHVYNTTDVARVVAYAHARGIRVIAEFDVPGHTFPSWDREAVLAGNSSLLTRCAQYASSGGYGPLRADREQTYNFVGALFAEVAAAFPDPVLNIGGDEVASGCYESNPEVATFLRTHNLTGEQLVGTFAKRVLGLVSGSLGKTPMMWRPGIGDLVAAADTPIDTIFDVYGGTGAHKADQAWYNETATQTTKAGFRVVRSAGGYLDEFCTLDPDGRHHGTYWGYWQGWNYYSMDPIVGQIDEKAGGRPELVIGGKVNAWGEHIDATNFMPRVWPRAAVLAERLWSAAALNDSSLARPRLHEFRCKLVRRGISAEPIASLKFGEGGPYHVAFCQHDSDIFAYRPPVPWYV